MMLTTTQTIILCLLRNNLHKDCISIILKIFHSIDVDEIDTSKIPRLFSSYEDVMYLEENVNESMFTNNFKLLLDINFFKEYLIENLKMETTIINLTDIMIKEKIKIDWHYLHLKYLIYHTNIQAIHLFQLFVG